MKAIVRLFLCALTIVLLSSKAKAISCYALTDTNHLLVFDSASPGSATDKGAITGLGGYALVGLDIRTTTQTTGASNPGVGSLWAIGNSGSLYQLFAITPSTPPSATAIGAPLSGLSTTPGPNGWFFGFDPSIDRIRFAGFQSNYLIDPNTATYVTQSTVSGFINFNGSAFTTASFGGSSQMYFVEVGGDTLNTSTSFSAGTYSTAGSLGIDVSLPSGLDIFENTTLLTASPGGITGLYNVNRSTGAATLIGAISGNPTVRGLAIQPTSFPPTLPVTVAVSGKKRVVTRKSVFVVKGSASCEAGVSQVQVKVGKAGFRNAAGTTSWRFKARLKHGVNVVKAQATGSNGATSSIVVVRIIRR